MIDGTGCSYHDIYPLHEIRMVQSHIWAIVVAGMHKKQRFVFEALPGVVYESEVKLGTHQLLSHISLPRGSPFLADKSYDSIAFLDSIKTQGCIPVIKIKGDTSRYQQIRHPLFIKSYRNTLNHDVYAKRTQIEGLFGNIKEKLGSHIQVFRADIAQHFAPIRLALFNISILVCQSVVWIIFRTVSTST